MSFEELLQAHLDGDLTPTQAEAFAAALKADPAARAAFAAALRQDVLLGEVLAEAPAAKKRYARWMAAAAIVLASLGIWWFAPRPNVRLESSTGDVRFDGASLSVPAGGAAVLRLKDGTRIHASADTRLDWDPSRVLLHQGTIAADVAPQPSGRPLVFATPQAEARVLGTRLLLSVDVEATLCKVEEGHVQLVNLATAQAVDLRGGGYAIAEPRKELKAEVVAAPPPGKPAVRIIAPSRWPKAYTTRPFREGALLYGDRGWRITTIPAEVDGALGIATLAEDKRSEEAELLIFELDRAAEVWVGIDGRAAKDAKRLPLWLQGWEATGLQIHSKTAGNSYYHLFRKRFPAGRVALGGNHHGGDTGAGVNYTVLVTEAK